MVIVTPLQNAKRQGYDYPLIDFKTEQELTDSLCYRDFIENDIDFCVCPYHNFKGDYLQIRRKRKDFTSKVMQYRIKWGI